uniref:Iminophenyl-pyruvate dimer synthase domain-containing protein n=1 Tax=Branchiostoma floridae TaxID=7739 RepID=C3ZH50_BRAFL|eukprot:XP_002592186.1 hypothetical protein BRAFLDRAFT_88077 [Branchiostoma floridae]
MERKLKLTIGIFPFLGLLLLANAGYPRLHFSGKFLADSATLNNDPFNFNIHRFNPTRDKACYLNYTKPHCNWNPNGSSDFRLVHCHVTKVCYKGGMCSRDDAIVGKRIIGSDDDVAGKMSDLDPNFQMYTAQLWGLVVGVEGAFHGNFKTNTVMDVWQRCKEKNCSGDPGTSGYWSSILTNVTWMKDKTGSAFINQLSLSNRVLNIKFTVDMMQEDPRIPDFAHGRVIGTISAVDGSPGFLPEFNRMMWWQGPQWLPPDLDLQQESTDKNTSDYCNAPFYVDDVNKKVVVDLSNSLPTHLNGTVVNRGNLFLVVFRNWTLERMAMELRNDCNALLEQYCVNLGRIPYTNPGFLLNDTGIATFYLKPVARRNPMMIVREERTTCPDSQHCKRQCTPVLVERLDGLYVGPAEDRVFRIPQPKTERPTSKAESEEDDYTCWSLTVFAAQFGEPKPGVRLTVQRHNRTNTSEPADAIKIANASDCKGYAKSTTNLYGLGALYFKTKKGGLDRSRLPWYRKHLFGQVFIYNVTLVNDNSFPPDLLTSTHLYSKLPKKNKYTWHEDIYPLFKLYQNLYPVMNPLFNLTSQESVTNERVSKWLRYAISLPIEDPNHMPVTRDLSPAKRDMILEWLKSSKETLGTPPDVLSKLEDLKKYLRTALLLEWATIPPYLSAYYSIKDGFNTEIASLLKGIVIEEMTHMSMVANILNFLGEAPNLSDPNLRPAYPGKLPGKVMPDLNVTLTSFSLNVTHDVFMAIEYPECQGDLLEVHKILQGIPLRVEPPPDAPRQCLDGHPGGNCDPLCGNITAKCNELNFNSSTIGAVYIHKILCPMVELYGSNREVFRPKSENLKKQVPIPFCVLDICTAIEGIKWIVGEGEGSDACNPFFNQKNETSHYYTFMEIWKGRQLKIKTNDTGDDGAQQTCPTGGCEVSTGEQSSDADFFDPCGTHCPQKYSFSGPKIPFNEEGVWPTIENPQTTDYPAGSRARILSDSFNKKYTNMMMCLHETYNGNPEMFNQCYALMTSLTVDAKRLVQTPIDADDGPHGAPTFEWYPPAGNN